MTRAWNIRLCLLSSLCVLLSVLPTWSGRPAEALASERGAPSGCTHCAPSPREMPVSWRPSGSVQKRLRTGPWSGREARDAERGGKGRVELRAPKYGSERVVFLAPGLVDMLAAHVAAHCPDGGWLFTGDASQPPHQNTVGYRWRRTTAAAGVAGQRLHDLRHFYASGLIASGCDVVTVQRALGHASATTTLNTYSHLWPSAEDRTRAAAQALLADSCGLGVDWAGSRSR